jgi:hypothetical protein
MTSRVISQDTPATLHRLLTGEIQPDIFTAGSRVSVADIRRKAAEHGWRVYRINGRKVNDKAEFLAESARGLAFPEYQGHNWDAFEESLNDLATNKAGPTLVLFDYAGQFAEANPEEFKVAQSILATAVNNRRKTDWPLAVVLRGAGEAGAKLLVLRM